MNNFIVAAVQLNSQDDVDANLAAIEKQVIAAAAAGAGVVVLPEYANYCSEKGRREKAEDENGPAVSLYRRLAREGGIYLHCGSYLEISGHPRRPFNTSLFIDPRGEIIARYRKIHLFDVQIPGQLTSRESEVITPGREAVTVTAPPGNFGFTICYDLRFPELYRHLTLQGAGLIFVPAAFTLYTGKDHWEPLLRARAIENQVYIVAAAQFGQYPPGRSSFGSSVVIDPWGTIIARASEGTGFITAPVDWGLLKRIRMHNPCLANTVSFKEAGFVDGTPGLIS